MAQAAAAFSAVLSLWEVPAGSGPDDLEAEPVVAAAEAVTSIVESGVASSGETPVGRPPGQRLVAAIGPGPEAEGDGPARRHPYVRVGMAEHRA